MIKQTGTLDDNHALNSAGFGPQSHAYADFARALRNHVREHAEEPNGTKNQRQR